ncbi:DUF397 domain-containing protein [Streptomyces sp. NPDC016845]|uniref:DUF397 domain-containing protein n=1 Tax=Streptomyces sp. NPDC016845 TaxID=3364972 RepID=UPI0037A3432E
MTWFRSGRSKSTGDGGCVEAATCPATTHVRGSKRTADPHLTLSSAAWTDFAGFAAR